MKNRSGDYKKLERKITLRALSLIILAVIIVLLLRSILTGSIAESVVSLIQRYFGLDYYDALNIYEKIFRNNKTRIMILTGGVLIWFFLRILASFISKYFDEISSGLDNLISQQEGYITMSEELIDFENKLNRSKDILQKRENDAKLAEQRKNDLVLYLAHDLKTPLTSIIGYLSLLDEIPDMPREQRARYIGITLEKANRLEDLINEFFEITRFNLQTIVLYKKEINLAFMMEQMAEEFYPMLRPANKSIEVNIKDDIMIYADPDKIARVFNNILKNAISYSYNDSKIDIIAWEKEDRSIIEISNKGDQIPEEMLETIFERFYRLDSSRSTQTGGSGLGLAISKEIVNAHKGEIGVESDEKFTKFIVELPKKIEVFE